MNSNTESISVVLFIFVLRRQCEGAITLILKIVSTMTEYNFQPVSQKQRFYFRKDFGALPMQNSYATEFKDNDYPPKYRSETNSFIVDWQLPTVEMYDIDNPE